MLSDEIRSAADSSFPTAHDMHRWADEVEQMERALGLKPEQMEMFGDGDQEEKSRPRPVSDQAEDAA